MGTPTAQDVALLVEGRTAPASSAAPQADWVRGAQTQRAAHRAVQACQNGQLPQAIAEAWAAVAQSPSKAENYALLGYILAKAGHHDRALGMYAKAAQLEPDTPAYQRRLWRHAAHHRPGYLHSLQGPALPALGCDEAAGVAQAKTHLGATGACAYVDGDIQYWIPVDGRTDGTGLQITSFKSGTWATQRIQLSAPPDSQLLHGRLPWPKGAEACVLTLCQDGARLAGSPLFGPHTLALPKAAPEDTDIVRVILPVYDGLDDLRACINALQAAPCKTPFTLILVLDCPPDPAITAFVQQLAARDGITVIENRENLGFTASVNQGLRRSGGADVVLLNSDTVVSAGWLDRLSAAAHSAPDIGTVTPLSNNGEITSYPVRSAQNPLPPGVTAAELDALAAEVNQGVTVDLPTGVGFCLFVKADCLAAVGLLDAHRFGKGYGEETDFCLRALRAGWRSVCAADVFVAHVSSVSFGAE
ncbi:MAG: glycosyltransferase, partial [Pseudomonadota bacterium]